MNTIHLNLARKWRSKNFDQIIGQDLSVKMLKNSLYLGSFFPVYLFSGQRGCGKTSLARIFAAAANCDALSLFQKDPTRQALPCLECSSCCAMSSATHPDFVEIDAASHTGVDMIRAVIDAANLLPLLGSKKVYLIDEAHMLSKASFNALLKVLEEPPQSVLFILATTDPLKIIDTVRSRCFQVFFKAIDASRLVMHISDICTQESIAYELDGLNLIVDETQGSARDALNLLEQVRFSSDVVSRPAVLKVLGRLSDELILQLIDVALRQSPTSMLLFLQEHAVENGCPEFLYQRFSDGLRALLWVKYGVAPRMFQSYQALMTQIASSSTLARLNQALQMMCDHEIVFYKTTAKYALFEMILLQLSQKNKHGIDDAGGTPVVPCIPQMVARTDEEIVDTHTDQETLEESKPQIDARNAGWQIFVASVPELKDPVVLSVFTQAVFSAHEGVVVRVELSKDLLFFKEWLDKTQTSWQPLLAQAFQNPQVQLEPLFILEKKGKVAAVANVKTTAIEKGDGGEKVEKKNDIWVGVQESQRVYTKTSSASSRGVRRAGDPVFDVSDVSKWQKINMVLHYFPGIVTEIKEQGNTL